MIYNENTFFKKQQHNSGRNLIYSTSWWPDISFFVSARWKERKGNALFNDVLNTFYLGYMRRAYGKGPFW